MSPFTGATYIDYTGTTFGSSYFRFKLNSTVSYTLGPASVGLMWQHLPSLAAPPGSAPGTLGASSYSLFNLYARYKLTDGIELRGGIDNLFNKWPEFVGAYPGNNAIGSTDANYDTIGRRFYLGVSAKL